MKAQARASVELSVEQLEERCLLANNWLSLAPEKWTLTKGGDSASSTGEMFHMEAPPFTDKFGKTWYVSLHGATQIKRLSPVERAILKHDFPTWTFTEALDPKIL